jgi:hypothetical protein
MPSESAQERTVVAANVNDQSSWLRLYPFHHVIGIGPKVFHQPRRALRNIEIVSVEQLRINYIQELHMLTVKTQEGVEGVDLLPLMAPIGRDIAISHRCGGQSEDQFKAGSPA